MRATWGTGPIFGPDLDLAVNRLYTKAEPISNLHFPAPPGTPEPRRFLFICFFLHFYWQLCCLHTFTGLARANGGAFSLAVWSWCQVPDQTHIQTRPGVFTRRHTQRRGSLGIHFCTLHQLCAMHAGSPHTNGGQAAAAYWGTSAGALAVHRHWGYSTYTEMSSVVRCLLGKVFWGTCVPRSSHKPK